MNTIDKHPLIVGFGNASEFIFEKINIDKYGIYTIINSNFHNTTDKIQYIKTNNTMLSKDAKQFFKANNNFVLFCAIGGETGGRLLLETVKFLSKYNKNYTVICSFPFSFEGKKRKQRAQDSLEKLLHYTDISLISQEVLRLNKPDLSITQAFDLVGARIREVSDKIMSNLWNL